MKRVFSSIKIMMTVLLMAVLVLFMVPQKTEALNYQDEILYYGITAHVLESGSVKFTYEIEWKVLDSAQGGVDFVMIGIPNRSDIPMTAVNLPM